MDRKLSNDVDGYSIDEYAGTFTGSFEVRGADARYFTYDDEVLLVVRARVKPPRIKESRNGDITRVNVLTVKEAGVVRSASLQQHLCDTLGLDLPTQLVFDENTAALQDVVESFEAFPEETSGETLEDRHEGAGGYKAESETDVQPDFEEDLVVQDDRLRPEFDRGPGAVERRLVGSTRDARLAAFLYSE